MYCCELKCMVEIVFWLWMSSCLQSISSENVVCFWFATRNPWHLVYPTSLLFLFFFFVHPWWLWWPNRAFFSTWSKVFVLWLWGCLKESQHHTQEWIKVYIRTTHATIPDLATLTMFGHIRTVSFQDQQRTPWEHLKKKQGDSEVDALSNGLQVHAWPWKETLTTEYGAVNTPLPLERMDTPNSMGASLSNDNVEKGRG